MSENRRGEARTHGGAGAALGHGLAALGLVAGLGANAALAEAGCTSDAVFVRNPAGSVVRFSVEIADDGAERALGLMNRAGMARAKGMLFVYAAPRRVSFWMKDTLIPLDMLFANAAGEVTAVHSMARPLDPTSIDGGDNVQFVLEINGGLAGQLGLDPGSVLRHPAIAPAGAIWPCAAG